MDNTELEKRIAKMDLNGIYNTSPIGLNELTNGFEEPLVRLLMTKAVTIGQQTIPIPKTITISKQKELLSFLKKSYGLCMKRTKLLWHESPLMGGGYPDFFETMEANIDSDRIITIDGSVHQEEYPYYLQKQKETVNFNSGTTIQIPDIEYDQEKEGLKIVQKNIDLGDIIEKKTKAAVEQFLDENAITEEEIDESWENAIRKANKEYNGLSEKEIEKLFDKELDKRMGSKEDEDEVFDKQIEKRFATIGPAAARTIVAVAIEKAEADAASQSEQTDDRDARIAELEKEVRSLKEQQSDCANNDDIDEMFNDNEQDQPQDNKQDQPQDNKQHQVEKLNSESDSIPQNLTDALKIIEEQKETIKDLKDTITKYQMRKLPPAKRKGIALGLTPLQADIFGDYLAGKLGIVFDNKKEELSLILNCLFGQGRSSLANKMHMTTGAVDDRLYVASIFGPSSPEIAKEICSDWDEDTLAPWEEEVEYDDEEDDNSD